MKKLISVILGLAIATALSLAFSFAAGAETEGIYTYTVLDGNATIVSCSDATSVAITIPSTLGGCPVTSVGDNAFVNCSNLISISLPSSIISLDEYAFFNLYNLTSINVDIDNQYFCSVNGVLFDKLKSLLIVYPAKKNRFILHHSK